MVLLENLPWQQLTRNIDYMLVGCWASVFDAGPTSNQHVVNVPRFPWLAVCVGSGLLPPRHLALGLLSAPGPQSANHTSPAIRGPTWLVYEHCSSCSLTEIDKPNLSVSPPRNNNTHLISPPPHNPRLDLHRTDIGWCLALCQIEALSRGRLIGQKYFHQLVSL